MIYDAQYFGSDIFILVVMSYLQHPFDILPSTLVTMISSTYSLCHLGICSAVFYINHLTKQFSSSHVTQSSLYFCFYALNSLHNFQKPLPAEIKLDIPGKNYRHINWKKCSTYGLSPPYTTKCSAC